jgi:molybdenum cofactor biosynthesis enzyme MoaA
VLYSFADKTRIIGFIPSITEPFCNKCDRIRITSDGKLLTCLYEKPGYDPKNILHGANSDEQIAVVGLPIGVSLGTLAGLVGIVGGIWLSPLL